MENGLNKLYKTQSEVDVLVENARAMALDVEQKVASANVFAEQVSCPSRFGSTNMCSSLLPSFRPLACTPPDSNNTTNSVTGYACRLVLRRRR